MKRKWRRNRLFALLLSFVLLLGMTPVTVAFAESDNSSGSEAMTESSEKKQGDASGDASSEEEKPADTRQEESDPEQEKTADVSQIKEEQSLSLVLGAGGSNAETGQAYEGSVNWEDLKVGDIIKAGTYTWNGNLVYDDGMKIYLAQTRGSIWSGSQDRIVTSFGQYNGNNVVILERLSNSSSYAVVRGEALTYNGHEQVLTKVGSVVGGTLYYSKDGGSTYTSTEAPKAKEVGTYTVWCKVIGDSSHDDSKPYCVTASINKEDGSASVSLDGWTYGQTANTPVPESNTNGTDHVTYSYSGTTKAGKAYGPSTTAPTEAGSYKVTATFAETDNYKACTAYASFTIAEAKKESSLKPTDNNGSKTNNVSNTDSKLSGTGVSSNTAAKTGDERDISLWFALMALCSAGLVEVVFICRKNMRKN